MSPFPVAFLRTQVTDADGVKIVKFKSYRCTPNVGD